MKKLILFTAILLSVLIVHAQKTFFPTKEGTVLLYKTYDKKKNLMSMMRYTVQDVITNNNDMDITYLCEYLDPHENTLFAEEITIYQKGDSLSFDMGKFVNKMALQENGQLADDVEITGTQLKVPLDPKPGDALPDAIVEMAVKTGLTDMNMLAELTNRKVVAVEDVTVTAGTFTAYKMSCDVYSTTMGIKTKTRNVDWYTKGIGTVKTENFDKNGKLQSRTELAEIY